MIPKGLNILLIFFVLMFGCDKSEKEKIVASATQTDGGHLKAEVVEVKSAGFLGEKYFLQITNEVDSTTLRITQDLLEGRGNYESAIVQLKWLSPDKLFLERALDDRPQGLIYCVSKVQFEDIGDSLSILFRKD